MIIVRIYSMYILNVYTQCDPHAVVVKCSTTYIHIWYSRNLLTHTQGKAHSMLLGVLHIEVL